MDKKCPVCGIDSKHAFLTKDWNRKITQIDFEYQKCPKCGLLFLANIPNDLDSYYGNDYYVLPRLQKIKNVAKRERYQMDMVLRFVQCGRLLEVGPGFGVFAYQAKQAGFEVDVIEKEQTCCDFLRDSIGVNAIKSDVPHKAIEGTPRYDVIAMWQVIEHLPYPWKFLENAAKKLNNNGILLIATPNSDAFQLKTLKSKWPHVDAPRHLNLIPEKLLIEYLEPFDLLPKMITFTDKGAKSWNKFGWQRYMMNNCSARLAKYSCFFLGYLVTGLMSVFEDKADKSSSYTIIFQKKS